MLRKIFPFWHIQTANTSEFEHFLEFFLKKFQKKNKKFQKTKAKKIENLFNFNFIGVQYTQPVAFGFFDSAVEPYTLWGSDDHMPIEEAFVSHPLSGIQRWVIGFADFDTDYDDNFWRESSFNEWINIIKQSDLPLAEQPYKIIGKSMDDLVNTWDNATNIELNPCEWYTGYLCPDSSDLDFVNSLIIGTPIVKFAEDCEPRLMGFYDGEGKFAEIPLNYDQWNSIAGENSGTPSSLTDIQMSTYQINMGFPEPRSYNYLGDVSIYNSSKHCGASIIADGYLMTSSHCLDKKPEGWNWTAWALGLDWKRVCSYTNLCTLTSTSGDIILHPEENVAIFKTTSIGNSGGRGYYGLRLIPIANIDPMNANYRFIVPRATGHDPSLLHRNGYSNEPFQN